MKIILKSKILALPLDRYKVLEHVASKKKNYLCFLRKLDLGKGVKILKELGFEVKKVVPVDMFPRTAHCEVVASVERLKG